MTLEVLILFHTRTTERYFICAAGKNLTIFVIVVTIVKTENRKTLHGHIVLDSIYPIYLFQIHGNPKWQSTNLMRYRMYYPMHYVIQYIN